MNRGIWHQFGHHSQTLALEQLRDRRGVGVILSPRDLSFDNAKERSVDYQGLGAEILVDQQFYEPDFTNRFTETYPAEEFRRSLSSLRRLKQGEMVSLAAIIESINSDLGASAVLAPAVCYEAGRLETADVNAALFGAARQAGDSLDIPVYATVVLGSSVTGSWGTIAAALDEATSLPADGWYFGFEFQEEARIPSDLEATFRCLKAGLKLACTGKPVLHAFAGPGCILSFCFGATGSAVGHTQNLWQFSRSRWQRSEGGGGGGDAPARFFSSKLWGTIVYPDEIARLDAELGTAVANQVLTKTTFTEQVAVRAPFSPLSRHVASKHLLAILCESGTRIARLGGSLKACAAVDKLLADAVSLHAQIEEAGIALADDTAAYQENWRRALSRLQRDDKQGFDVLKIQGL